MPYTEAGKRATIKYMKENLEEIRLRQRIGIKDKWKKYAEVAGESLTQFIVKSVEARIKNEFHDSSIEDEQ